VKVGENLLILVSDLGYLISLDCILLIIIVMMGRDLVPNKLKSWTFFLGPIMRGITVSMHLILVYE
jgi:hypothetical protein